MEKYNPNKDYSSTTTRTLVKEEFTMWEKAKSLWNNHKGKIITGVVIGIVGYVGYKHVQRVQSEIDLSESLKELVVSEIDTPLKNGLGNEVHFLMEDGKMIRDVDELIVGLKPEIIGNEEYYTVSGISKMFEETKDGLIEMDGLDPTSPITVVRTIKAA